MKRILFFLLSLSAVPMALTAMEQEEHKEQALRRSTPPEVFNYIASRIEDVTHMYAIQYVAPIAPPLRRPVIRCPRLNHTVEQYSPLLLSSVLSRELDEDANGIHPVD